MTEITKQANRYSTYLAEGKPLRTPYQIKKSVGGINIGRLFESLGIHDGSSYLDLLKEYIDNAFDWGSSKVTIRFDVKSNKIIITDDGYGMNINSFQKFCELWSDNDLNGQNEKVDGKFGIGVKKANRVLSNKQFIEIKTVKDGKLINAKIDYEKILRENKYDKTSVPIEISDTSLSNGTEIIISTTDEIITYFEDLYKSKKIDENLRFDLAITYNPKILEGKEINLEFYDETTEEISEKIKAIPFESDNFITKTYIVNLYKAYDKKTFIYALDLDSKSDIKNTCSYPYHSLEEKNLHNYTNLNSSFKIELRFPKETKEFTVRKGGKEKINVCTINDRSNIKFYENIKSIYKIKESNTKILDYFKHIHIKRNTRILASLNFDVREISKGSDLNIKNEYNCCLKTISYKSTIDEYLPLAQETKSKVDWKKCPKGLKKFIVILIKKFVNCDVKTFMNEPIEGEDYSITDDEESGKESEFETDSDSSSESEFEFEKDSKTGVDSNVKSFCNVDLNSEDGNINDDVNIDDANVDVNIDDANIDVNVDDVNGNVNIDDANVDINVDDVNGNVNIDDANVDVNIDDANVDVNIDDANVDINIDVANVDVNIDDANVDDDVDSDSDDSETPIITESNLKYLYAVTCMENNRVNPNINDGFYEKKIGVTNQRINKRLSGGNEYKKNYEQDHKFKINKIGCENVNDIYNRKKYRIEVELYNKLIQIEGVNFLENSTEKFKCSIEKENEVEDAIIEVGRKYRQ